MVFAGGVVGVAHQVTFLLSPDAVPSPVPTIVVTAGVVALVVTAQLKTWLPPPAARFTVPDGVIAVLHAALSVVTLAPVIAVLPSFVSVKEYVTESPATTILVASPVVAFGAGDADSAVDGWHVGNEPREKSM